MKTRTLIKTNILKIIAIVLIVAGSFSSCKDKEKPVEVFFTEYSLAKTSCYWTNLKYNDMIIVVNSNEELEKYIYCTDGSNYPVIDFSKYMLLLASGISGDVRQVDAAFLKNSRNEYIMKVTIHLGIAAVAGVPWNKAILVSKISNDVTIILEKQETYY